MAARNAQLAIKALEAEYSKLHAQSFEKVKELPDYSELPHASINKKHTVAVWKDDLEDGSVRVVLQSQLYRFLGISSMYAKGYIFKPDGQIDEVPENELWSYM